MNSNEQLIHKFYTAFQQLDYKTMQNCYADNATFSDTVFTNLDGKQVRAMWEMLCKRAADLKLEYANVVGNEWGGSAEWTAYYTFSATGNKVVNRIKADFLIENGKITKHTDNFDFYTWVKQSLGFTGVLLGRTSFLKKKVQKGAMKNLSEFMAANNL